MAVLRLRGHFGLNGCCRARCRRQPVLQSMVELEASSTRMSGASGSESGLGCSGWLVGQGAWGFIA